jgi:uncharacterized protein
MKYFSHLSIESVLNYQDFLWILENSKKRKIHIMSEKEALSILDRSEIINFLFYPRQETPAKLPDFVKYHDVISRDGVRINARLYLSAPENPHLLFFHGNGEIAQDYDEIGQIFTQFGMNFIVVDYRGYGRSEGRPTVSTMLYDAHEMLASVLDWLKRENRKGHVWVMGRSLGSAPAIELASAYPEKINGLIIESGFAETLTLLQRLGIDTRMLEKNKTLVFSNAEKITRFTGPTLIIHAQYDQIIPFSHGEDLFRRSPAAFKKIHMVHGADHNSILMVAGMGYFELIRDFIKNASQA